MATKEQLELDWYNNTFKLYADLQIWRTATSIALIKVLEDWALEIYLESKIKDLVLNK